MYNLKKQRTNIAYIIYSLFFIYLSVRLESKNHEKSIKRRDLFEKKSKRAAGFRKSRGDRGNDCKKTALFRNAVYRPHRSECDQGTARQGQL